MVLIFDGNSEIGAHVKVIAVIWSVQGIWSDCEQSQIGFFLQKGPIFLYKCAKCTELPSNISTVCAAPAPQGTSLG